MMTDATLTSTATERAHGLGITDAAAQEVRALRVQEGRDDLRLRVAVQPGGCSGMSYQLYFDDRTLDGDAIVDFDGIEIIVDVESAPYLDGALVDYEDTQQRQGFTIDNPNAVGGCACGDSFC
jgi:iron-sulfur cluster assembly accessory protein